MKDNLKVVVMNARKKDDPFCFGSSFFILVYFLLNSFAFATAGMM